MIALGIFSWIAVAKRHLSFDELREPISIEIVPSYLKLERLVDSLDCSAL